MKPFTLYLLHSSHTDVGYTDTQEKMKFHHVAFIREVLELIEHEPRFKWNCESYWCVEQFLKEATPEETQAFVRAVKKGNIGLSASYLNLTDLVPEYVHQGIMDACTAQRAALGIPARSAMTADVNGYSWGFADILAQQGVTRLMSSIHTHHGYHPLFRKQTPFYWESPKGHRILCWNGDHYNLGNELGIAQAAWFEYTLQDGMSFEPLPDFEKAVRRIDAYAETLQAQGYSLDFAPVCLSGNMTDNSPPSLRILDFIDRYQSLGKAVTLKMATLDEFFDALEKSGASIPAYRGDWTDWWADGVGSTPADVMQYRASARSYHIVQKLDPEGSITPASARQAALYNLMFYGEHTWGYSSSITEPFHPQVNNLDQWKRLYALKACESATIAREALQRAMGETAISLHRELTFCAVNPHDEPVQEIFRQDLEHFYGHEHFTVVDEATGKEVPFQLSRYSRGPEICIELTLAPKEKKKFRLQEQPRPALPSAGLKAPTGIEGVDDLNWHVEQQLAEGGCATCDWLENQFYKITFTPEQGITSVFDKLHGRELIAEGRPSGAFTPLSEVTERDIGEDYLFVRRNMGRNRKAARTHRCPGVLYDVRVLENGALYTRVELKYRIDGAKECSVILTAFKFCPRLDVDFRIHKQSVWEPENLYLSLPFEGEVWLDKTAAQMRPRVDQLPGTCIDFYAVQNGLVFRKEESSLIVTTPDVPLVWMGTLRPHPIRLMGEGAPNADETYSWVMNNFWETNFKASLGGFYQFHYSLELSDTQDVQAAFRKAEALCEGVLSFYRFEEKKEG